MKKLRDIVENTEKRLHVGTQQHCFLSILQDKHPDGVTYAEIKEHYRKMTDEHPALDHPDHKKYSKAIMMLKSGANFGNDDHRNHSVHGLVESGLVDAVKMKHPKRFGSNREHTIWTITDKGREAFANAVDNPNLHRGGDYHPRPPDHFKKHYESRRSRRLIARRPGADDDGGHWN